MSRRSLNERRKMWHATELGFAFLHLMPGAHVHQRSLTGLVVCAAVMGHHSAFAQDTGRRSAADAITGSGRGGDAASVEGNRAAPDVNSGGDDREPAEIDSDPGERATVPWIGLAGLMGLAGLAGLGRSRARRSIHVADT